MHRSSAGGRRSARNSMETDDVAAGDKGRRSARNIRAPKKYDPDEEAAKPQWGCSKEIAAAQPRIKDTVAVAGLVPEDRRLKRKSPAPCSYAPSDATAAAMVRPFFFFNFVSGLWTTS